MTENDPEEDLHDEIDDLAADIERKIAEGEAFISQLPDFSPRSQRSRGFEKASKNYE